MSEEWITAREAREMVSPGCEQDGAHTDAICHRAKAGLVRAKAKLWQWSEAGEEHDYEIPRGFWDVNELEHNWSQGDFTNTTCVDGPEYHFKAFGVTFERTGIEAMSSPPVASTIASPSPVPDHHPKGGAPGKYDWATAVGTVVFQWSDRGSWHPKSQGEVKTKLAEWFSEQGQTPDGTQLKVYARWLYGEFTKRKPAAE